MKRFEPGHIVGQCKYLLSFQGLLREKVTVKLFVTLAKDSFKLARFSPNVNNIQYSWYFGDDTSVLETLGWHSHLFPVFHTSLAET